MIRSLLREPLLHFVIVALALFLLLDGGDYPADSAVIKISQTNIQSMKDEWQKRWRRPATQAELDGIIDSAVREELYYREGLRLGLDRDDAVVRNRMIQKMKFLQHQQVPDPDKSQLETWLQEHKADYPDLEHISFQQVFIGAEVSQTEIEQLLSKLNSGALSADAARQDLLAPKRMKNATAQEISRNFGHSFYTQLSALKRDQWSGPVRSGFGIHLVKIESVRAIAVSLDTPEVLQKVRNDWINAQKQIVEQQFVQGLLDRYQVEIESR